MSMRCITVPPRMKPSGLASFGRTTCTISVKESPGRLEVVPNPEAELHLTEEQVARGQPVRAGRNAQRGRVRREERVFPAPVEERPPREIEVHREPEEEALEPEPVGGAAVDQPEPADGHRIARHRREVAERILREADGRRERLG